MTPRQTTARQTTFGNAVLLSSHGLPCPTFGSSSLNWYVAIKRAAIENVRTAANFRDRRLIPGRCEPRI